MINIAVLGYGTVGSGVVEVINKNHASINKRAGQEVNIKYVLDLRDFPGDPVEKVLVHDYNVIVNDPEVKIIVYRSYLHVGKMWECGIMVMKPAKCQKMLGLHALIIC